MRMAFTVQGSYSDRWLLPDALNLHASVVGALQGEGWIVQRASFAEKSTWFGTVVLFDGHVEVDTQSTSVERVRARLGELLQRVTGRPTVVTTGLGSRPVAEEGARAAQRPGLTSAIVWSAIALVAIAVIVVRVKP